LRVIGGCWVCIDHNTEVLGSDEICQCAGNDCNKKMDCFVGE